MINASLTQKNDFKPQDNPMILDIEHIAKSRLSPIANRIDQDGYYPIDIMADLGKAGAFAQHLDFNDNGSERSRLLISAQKVNASGKLRS